MDNEPEHRRFSEWIEAATATYVSAASLHENRMALFAPSGDSAVLACLPSQESSLPSQEPHDRHAGFASYRRHRLRCLPEVRQGQRSWSGPELWRLLFLGLGQVSSCPTSGQGRRLFENGRPVGRGRAPTGTRQPPDTVLQRTAQAALLHSVVMPAILEANRPKLGEPLFAPCLRRRRLSHNSDEYRLFFQ